ncbi:DinB family protein [Runella sp. MFBS21]|uniref:DinB family protein n=1 Tax=Runella sp. MFBS21 TaxID=3034018 RepID=UPI0023FA3D16|nr:DinB family protein [Runella sp. MFBS21]MDF7819507.1 DinB family protein [Runella sp. MFBS21]
MNLLLKTNRDILSQIDELLQVISYSAYSSPLEVLHGSTVGQHIRHTLEFYQCLYQQAPLGFVDYDARLRDLRLETDLAFSRSLIHQLKNWLSESLLNTPLSMKVFLGNEDQSIIHTSLCRELLYMIEHAIHHLAIIKIAITGQFPKIQIPAHFGVAYSTLRYRESALK